MKGIKYIMAVIVFTALLTSCGSLRNKSKQSDKQTIEVLTKRDCVTVDKSTTIAQVIEQASDKGVIVTEKETTTVTEKPASTVKVTAKTSDLKPGNNFLQDSAGQMVNVILDSLGSALTIEFQTPGEKTTKVEKERKIEQKDEQTNKQSKKEDKKDMQSAVAATGERREETKSSSSDSKANIWAIFANKIAWAIGVVIVALVVLWYFGIKRKK